jgi:hypothetical protein
MNDRTPTQQELLSQAIDRETRYVIGELTMQTIILRQALNMSQQPQPQPVNPVPQPMPPKQPEPIPPQPEQDRPPPPRQSMPNGGWKEAR